MNERLVGRFLGAKPLRPCFSSASPMIDWCPPCVSRHRRFPCRCFSSSGSGPRWVGMRPGGALVTRGGRGGGGGGGVVCARGRRRRWRCRSGGWRGGRGAGGCSAGSDSGHRTSWSHTQSMMLLLLRRFLLFAIETRGGIGQILHQRDTGLPTQRVGVLFGVEEPVRRCVTLHRPCRSRARLCQVLRLFSGSASLWGCRGAARWGTQDHVVEQIWDAHHALNSTVHLVIHDYQPMVLQAREGEIPHIRTHTHTHTPRPRSLAVMRQILTNNVKALVGATDLPKHWLLGQNGNCALFTNTPKWGQQLIQITSQLVPDVAIECAWGLFWKHTSYGQNMEGEWRNPFTLHLALSPAYQRPLNEQACHNIWLWHFPVVHGGCESKTLGVEES